MPVLRIRRLALRHLIATPSFARQGLPTVLVLFATLAPHGAQGLDVVEFRADGKPEAEIVTGEEHKNSGETLPGEAVHRDQVS